MIDVSTLIWFSPLIWLWLCLLEVIVLLLCGLLWLWVKPPLVYVNRWGIIGWSFVVGVLHVWLGTASRRRHKRHLRLVGVIWHIWRLHVLRFYTRWVEGFALRIHLTRIVIIWHIGGIILGGRLAIWLLLLLGHIGWWCTRHKWLSIDGSVKAEGLCSGVEHASNKRVGGLVLLGLGTESTGSGLATFVELLRSSILGCLIRHLTQWIGVPDRQLINPDFKWQAR